MKPNGVDDFSQQQALLQQAIEEIQTSSQALHQQRHQAELGG